jgi:hypothetical protein
MEISGEKLWDTILLDSRFIDRQPAVIRRVLKPYIEDLPQILADFLELPVTASNLLKAKHAFLKHCLDTDLDEKIIQAHPYIESQSGATLRERMFIAVVDYVSIIHHLNEFLKIHGIDEDEYCIDQFLLSKELEEAYLRNELKIGDLLQAIPLIFIRHDPKP